MNNDIRKYINLVESAQETGSNITRIARYISRSTNHGAVIGFQINKSITIYSVPIDLESIGVAWRARTERAAGYIEVELLYNSSPEQRKKIADAASNTNRAIPDYASYDHITEYYLGTNRDKILTILNEINLGFSTAALSELSTHARIESIAPGDDKSFSIFSLIYSTVINSPQPQMMSELARAIQYKQAIDEMS